MEPIQQAFESVMGQLIEAMPKVGGAVLLLFLGWLLAKLISALVARLLRRLKVDELANRLNQSPTFREVNLIIRPVGIIKQFLYWIILLIFVLSAAEVMQLNIVTQQIGALIQFLPRLVTALIILGVGFYLADAIRSMVGNTARSFGIPAWRFISSIIFYLLLLVVVVTALNQAGIDTEIITSNVSVILAGILLAFAIAYGFAARNVLASILTSFYSKNQFELGQEIEMEDTRGTIVRLTNVSVTLDTSEKLVVFPLHRLLEEKVIIHRGAPNLEGEASKYKEIE